MDLEECYKKGFIKKININTELIKSLIEMADINEQTVKTALLTKINISSYVSLAYDSLREILEAIAISNCYKVTSHSCLGELLKNLLKDFDYYEFDRLRYTRNGINYYGIKIDFQQGKEIINKIFNMKNSLLKKYLKDYK